MECFIPETIFFHIAISEVLIPITARHATALGLLIIYSRIRRTSLSGHANWTMAHQPIGPSLNPSPAPMTTARAGVTGIFTWWMGWAVVIPTVMLAFDLFFLNGRLICANTVNILMFIEACIVGIGSIAVKLLRAIGA